MYNIEDTSVGLALIVLLYSLGSVHYSCSIYSYIHTRSNSGRRDRERSGWRGQWTARGWCIANYREQKTFDIRPYSITSYIDRVFCYWVLCATQSTALGTGSAELAWRRPELTWQLHDKIWVGPAKLPNIPQTVLLFILHTTGRFVLFLAFLIQKFENKSLNQNLPQIQ